MSEVKLILTLDDRGFVTGLKTDKGAVVDFADTGKKAGNTITQAFHDLGIKSSKEIDGLKAKATEAFQKIKSSGTASAEDVARAEGALRNEIKNLNAEMESTGRNTELVSKNFGVLAENVAKYALAYMGVYAVINKVKEGLATQVDFEARMDEVSTLVDTTKVNMEGLEEQVLRMGPELGKMPADLTEGLYQLISAGTKAADSMGELRVSAKTAIAGLTDTGTAVDVLTTVLNAYGMDASQAQRVSDSLFTTVRDGKTRFAELATAIGPVLPFAAQLHVSLEEVDAAMSALTASGISTDEAATALRGTFAQLIQQAGQFRARGVDIIQVAGEQGLSGVLEKVKEITHGNQEEMRKLVPDIRALTAVMSLAGTASERFKEHLIDQANAAGATEAAYQKMTNNTKFAIGRLSATWDVFWEHVRGNAILRNLVEWLTWDVEKATELSDVLKEHSAAIKHALGYYPGFISDLNASGVAAAEAAFQQKKLNDEIERRNYLRGVLQGLSGADLQAQLGVSLTGQPGLKNEMQQASALADTLTRLGMTYGEFVKNIAEGSVIYDEVAGEWEKLDKAIKLGGDSADEAAEKIKKLNERIQAQIDKLTLSDEELIKKQAQEWIAAGADKVKVGQWVADQLIKIEQKRVEKIDAIIKENDDWWEKHHKDEVDRIAEGYQDQADNYQKFLDMKEKMTGSEIDHEIKAQEDQFDKFLNMAEKAYQDGYISYEEYQKAMLAAGQYTQGKIADLTLGTNSKIKNDYKDLGGVFQGVMNSMIDAVNGFLGVFGVQLPAAIVQVMRSMDALGKMSGAPTGKGFMGTLGQGLGYSAMGYGLGDLLGGNNWISAATGLAGSIFLTGAMTSGFGLIGAPLVSGMASLGIPGAIAASIVPVIGTVIGAVIGSVVSGLFGKERPPAMNLVWKNNQSPIGQGWSGVQVPNFIGGNMEIVGQHGAPTDSSQLTPLAQAFVNSAQQVKDVMEQLGLNVEGFNKEWSSYIADMSNMTSDQIQALLKSKLAEFIQAESGINFTGLKDQGEALSDTIDRIVGAMGKIASFKNLDIQSVFNAIDIVPDTAKQAVDSLTKQITDDLSDLPGLMGSEWGDKITEIGDLLDERLQASIQYVTYIKQLQAQVNQSISAQIEKYTTAGMTETQKMMYYYQNALDTWDKLQHETDPTKIGNLTGQLQQDLDGLYNSLMQLKQAVDALESSAKQTWESMNLEMMPSDQARIDYVNQQFKYAYGQYEAAKAAGNTEQMTYWGQQVVSYANQGWNMQGVDKQKTWAEISPILQEVETDMASVSKTIQDVITDELVPALTALNTTVQDKLSAAIDAETQAINDLKDQIGQIDWSPALTVNVDVNGTEATAKIQSYASGTDYVRQRHLAYVDEGEAVVTAYGNKGIAVIASALQSLVNKIDSLVRSGEPVNIYLSADLAPLISVASDAGAKKAISVIRRNPAVIGA